MLNYRITFTLTASSLEDASANTALSLPKQMQISLQACCRCVLLYCCLTNYPNGRGLSNVYYVSVGQQSRHSLSRPSRSSGSVSSQQTSPISRLAWDGAPFQLPHSSTVLRQDSVPGGLSLDTSVLSKAVEGTS